MSAVSRFSKALVLGMFALMVAAPSAADAASKRARRKDPVDDKAADAPADKKRDKDAKTSTRATRYTRLPQMEIHARDLRLTDDAKAKLLRIAERFHHATGERLVITGGWRSARRQAQLMIEKLEHGDDMVALYELKDAAREVETAYRDAKKHAKPRSLAPLDAAQKVIERQMERDVFISKHLMSGAVDIKSRGLKKSAVDALREAVSAESGASLLDERDGAEPHFHLALTAEARP